ncbi:hypothetical protein [Paracoccus actinidiae]|uniref:hypothetical protein n=1 Tax=Paracoccus actinidiae TaxID=3064531 RepID=UPI0027D1EE4F|nr:hypothetical protein [Paracoccus sp. M09]
MRPVKWLGLPTIVAAMLLESSMCLAQAQAFDPRATYEEAISRVFLDQGAIAVSVPRGIQIGDIYDLKPPAALLYRSQDCFPSLVAPQPGPAEFLQEVRLSKADVQTGFSWGLGKASLKADFQQLGILKYEDATFAQVSPRELLKALDTTACPEAEAPLLSRFVKIDQPIRPLLIVSGTYIAKPTIFFGLVANADAGVVVNQILAAAGASFDVQASGGQQKSVMLKSKAPVVVAVTPAVIYETRTSKTLGVDPPAEAVVGHQWMEFDPENRPLQLPLLAEFFNGAIGTGEP